MATTQPAVDPFAVLASVPPLELNSLKIDCAELDWLDRAAPAPVELKVGQVYELEDGRLVRVRNYLSHAEALEATGLRE